MDVLYIIDILSGIGLVVFLIWGSWYIYWDVRRRWLIPEEQGNARVLLFGLVCVVIAGIIVFLSLLVDFEILPDFRLWSLGWIE
ncbi:MAG: hypothetical protein KC584_02175 [Nitrospira sp.]|nr:hypothetical protein [Nitrospira sp.]